MKHIIRIIYLFAAIHLSLGYLAVAQTKASVKPDGRLLKLMTYNLKFASPTFQPSWEVRRDMQIDLIHKYAPDIIGTQEGLKEQIDYLADHLPEYVVIGEDRKGGDDDEHMAIFFRRDKFRLREMQSFQLSETPEIIGSGPEVNPRMVTWARLALINRPNEGEKSPNPQDYRGHWENNCEFYVFNTHYFNGPDASLAKLNASKLILKRINALSRFGEWRAERPLFLMGDFNCRPGTDPYRVLVGDKNSIDPELLKNTFEDVNKIDWILYKGEVKVLKYEEVTYNVNGVYPSDHKGSSFSGFNTSLIKAKLVKPEQKQYQWLTKKLKESQEANHIILFSHYPFFNKTVDEPTGYSNIDKGYREKYLTLFKETNVNGLFSGHLHNNKLLRDGQMQFVTTSAIGKPLGDAPSGMRIVKIYNDKIEHTYFGLEELPDSVQLTNLFINKPIFRVMAS